MTQLFHIYENIPKVFHEYINSLYIFINNKKRIFILHLNLNICNLSTYLIGTICKSNWFIIELEDRKYY